jgi:hypothetical protein
LRKLGHAGSVVGMVMPGTIGSVRLDGMLEENATDSAAVVPAGWVWPKAHTGCVPLGALIVTRMREPGR